MRPAWKTILDPIAFADCARFAEQDPSFPRADEAFRVSDGREVHLSHHHGRIELEMRALGAELVIAQSN